MFFRPASIDGQLRTGLRVSVFSCLLLSCLASTQAVTLDEAIDLYRSGKYHECSAAAATAIANSEYAEGWRLLKIEADMAVGNYSAAVDTLTIARRRYYSSIQLRWLGAQVYRTVGLAQEASQLLDEISVLVERSPWTYNEAADRVVLGQYFLAQGADARRVLNLFYDRAKKSQPTSPAAFIAAGQLALEKHDYQLAAKEFEQALKLDEHDANIYLGLAKAFETSDSERSTEFLKKALEQNPSHTPSLLFAAEEKLDAEKYEEAKTLLDAALRVNPELNEAWALFAVIANLCGEYEKAGHYRRIALGWWPLDPRVDHLIGQQLSQHYRFREGAEHQRRALRMDGKYLPAKFQLAQDLLHLGEEEEGWQLAAEVFQIDGYNVVAHNLVQLEDRLQQFVTLQGTNFLLRMDAREAAIYGPRVVALLERVSTQLSAKYQYVPPEPVVVELFPAQQDFAIRTFGLPGGEGFLGVCFGRVVTANSAAAQSANLSNWESILWHEYCHVITLGKTENRIPRWLSEGLSVYEEVQANPGWGQRMTADYRQMILKGQLTPLSKLSTAFLEPPSPLHLQFAYFEAYLVIEFLVENFGFESIVHTLADVGRGLLLEDALPRYTAPLALLDEQFERFARQKAESFAPQLDWSEPDRDDRAKLAEWILEHPQSYFAQRFQIEQAMEAEDWPTARERLEQLVALCPEFAGSSSPYPQLANVCQKMGDTERERAVLEQWVQRDGDALDALERLAELTAERQDWSALKNYAEQALAINPLVPEMHRHLAQAAVQLGDGPASIQAFQALLALDPIDPADVHYRMAEQFMQQGNRESARRHVLEALEEAPRFRAAHQLLLRIVDQAAPGAAPSTAAPTAPAPTEASP